MLVVVAAGWTAEVEVDADEVAESDPWLLPAHCHRAVIARRIPDHSRLLVGALIYEIPKLASP